MRGAPGTFIFPCSALHSARDSSLKCIFPMIHFFRSILSTNSIPDEKARKRLISDFDLELTEPEWSLGFRWDIVLRGREGTPFEE